ncbi:hypothetical protein OG689_07475 [Kitasatospora sp. NBC_00240]|uniref:hypothetical protein n=1 Tax=Kitasatospora sp. NBC_00240 TaxID=2903567 RepID=UPI002250E086|nr:hypothetical protein [Kitasatospora sp. NBC_00240]MCX5209126.1 hypothetical protein [Kitasatospora sp. NBC_00240]
MGIKSRSTGFIRPTAVVAVLMAPFAFAAPARADTADSWVSDNCAVANNPDCRSGVNVLWVNYNSVDANGYTDSASAHFLGKVSDYAGMIAVNGSLYTTYHYIFSNGGNGSGQAVKNNAASVLACSSAANYRVYFNSNYGGHSQYISGDWGCNNGVNLDSTLHNNNASQAWG